MTVEEKELLLKDLCARLRCGVKVRLQGKPRILFGVQGNLITIRARSEHGGWEWNEYDIEEWNIKPYLRPLDSMTVEEKIEFKKIVGYWECGPFEKNYDNIISHYNLNYRGINNLCTWLYQHHFDFNELIPMGLALPAPKRMYKTKQ